MSKVLIILLFNLTSMFLLAQEVDNLIFSKLEEAVKSKELDIAKSLLTKIENLASLNEVEEYLILEQKINICRLEHNRIEEIELMTEYVLKPELDSLFETNKRLTLFRPQNDTTIVYLRKSTYSKELANNHNLNKNHSEALKFLKLHESKYLFPHPCGNGFATDRVQRQILYGEIYQALSIHDSVIYKLLPLTFDYSMLSVLGKKFHQKKIDSLLLISLETKYSDTEIIQEFE